MRRSGLFFGAPAGGLSVCWALCFGASRRPFSFRRCKGTTSPPHFANFRPTFFRRQLERLFRQLAADSLQLAATLRQLAGSRAQLARWPLRAL